MARRRLSLKGLFPSDRSALVSCCCNNIADTGFPVKRMRPSCPFSASTRFITPPFNFDTEDRSYPWNKFLLIALFTLKSVKKKKKKKRKEFNRNNVRARCSILWTNIRRVKSRRGKRRKIRFSLISWLFYPSIAIKEKFHYFTPSLNNFDLFDRFSNKEISISGRKKISESVI